MNDLVFDLFRISNVIGRHVVQTGEERTKRVRACSDPDILLAVRDDHSLQHGVRQCAATQLELVRSFRRLGSRGLSLVDIHGQEAVDSWRERRPGVLDAYEAALATWNRNQAVANAAEARRNAS